MKEGSEKKERNNTEWIGLILSFLTLRLITNKNGKLLTRLSNPLKVAKSSLTPCATFFSVRVRARDRARARTETTSFAKLLKIDS